MQLCPMAQFMPDEIVFLSLGPVYCFESRPIAIGREHFNIPLLTKSGGALKKRVIDKVKVSWLKYLSMECPFCEHSKAHKHGQTSKGSQRYRCPVCSQTFTETLDTLYYWRQISSDKIEQTLNWLRVLPCDAICLKALWDLTFHRPSRKWLKSFSWGAR